MSVTITNFAGEIALQIGGHRMAGDKIKRKGKGVFSVQKKRNYVVIPLCALENP